MGPGTSTLLFGGFAGHRPKCMHESNDEIKFPGVEITKLTVPGTGTRRIRTPSCIVTIVALMMSRVQLRDSFSCLMSMMTTE